MTPEIELRHLDSGASTNEIPPGILLSLDVRCDSDVGEVITKTKSVLRLVIAQGTNSLSVETWKQTLPSWFVEACVERTTDEVQQWLAWWRTLSAKDKTQASERRGWSLDNWLYWLDPAHRTWYWWDSKVVAYGRALIVVETEGAPAPLGALIWLIKTAGAANVIEWV